MENNIKNILQDIYSFAYFVKQNERYDSLVNDWVELEIINALALSDLDDFGRRKAEELWEIKYKKEAEPVLRKFLEKLNANNEELKINLEFSCSIYQDQEKHYQNIISATDKSFMINMLEQLASKDGYAYLEIYPSPQIGISKLSLCSENGKYLFDLLVFSENSVEVRCANLPNTEKGLVEFGGELYPANSVITDFEFIKKVFLIFLTTYDVPLELMC